MGWEDRPYYRDRGQSGFNPLMWMMTGSVPLFTAFGIRVRAHATLVIYVGLVLLLGFGYAGFSVADRVIYSTLLFGIILLHEFGHCFAARWVGGTAEDILMHPLGGLAFSRPPHRPLPTFITVAAGPAVNLVICLLCAAILAIFSPAAITLNPFRPHPPVGLVSANWFNALWYVFWINQVSYQLLLFNLLPIFPLDGGQMLQAILWPRFGYYKSMYFACTTGMVGSVIGSVLGILWGNLLMVSLAVMGFLTCLNLRRQLQMQGPESEPDTTDYSAAYEIDPDRKRRKRGAVRKWWSARQSVQVQREVQDEQDKIDRILAKVSSQGMNSLTWREKRILKQATEDQRKRELERRRAH